VAFCSSVDLFWCGISEKQIERGDGDGDELARSPQGRCEISLVQPGCGRVSLAGVTSFTVKRP
jgi:hypothetical protein